MDTVLWMRYLARVIQSRSCGGCTLERTERNCKNTDGITQKKEPYFDNRSVELCERASYQGASET